MTDHVDTRANKYALRCFCVTIAAFTLAWILNQLNIFIVDKQIMTQGFCQALLLFAVCLLLCRYYGMDKPGMKYILLFFIIAITTVIGARLTYHSVILSALPIVYSAMYRNTRRMTVYTYLLTVVSICVIVFEGYRTGLCDANMALLTSKPLADYVAADGTFLQTQINQNPMLTLSLYFIFPRCVMCGVIVPICINISDIIAESRIREEEMRVLAEIDGMTGLYNKSKYLELVSNPYMAEERIGVIYWDVNGLKRINDSLGHEYGDKLILTISDSIKRLSSPNEKAYRVGGDEFVMILRGASEATVKNTIERWRESIAGVTVGNTLPVSAAVGYACGSGAELEQLIRQADEAMYENKHRYYVQAEENR